MQAVSLIKYSIKIVRLKTTNITRHKETFHKSQFTGDMNIFKSTVSKCMKQKLTDIRNE